MTSAIAILEMAFGMAFPSVMPVLLAAFLAQASPGPATLAIAREAMAYGRGKGIALALGVTTGSWIWSALAAAGMTTLLLAHDALIIGLRLLAALYLGWLAYRSARSALGLHSDAALSAPATRTGAYGRGLLIHLTNPKAILFFAALYAFGLPENAGPVSVFVIASAVAIQSLLVFTGLALVFSCAPMATGYARLRRGFEALFATVFASAAIGFLASALRPAQLALTRSPG